MDLHFRGKNVNGFFLAQLLPYGERGQAYAWLGKSRISVSEQSSVLKMKFLVLYKCRRHSGEPSGSVCSRE